LNFGNPERPAIMWQLAKAVEGIGERAVHSACRLPVATSACTTKRTPRDLPTPVIGVVGLLAHADRFVTRRFQAAGNVVVLMGEGRGELGAAST